MDVRCASAHTGDEWPSTYFYAAVWFVSYRRKFHRAS